MKGVEDEIQIEMSKPVPTPEKKHKICGDIEVVVSCCPKCGKEMMYCIDVSNRRNAGYIITKETK